MKSQNKATSSEKKWADHRSHLCYFQEKAKIYNAKFLNKKKE